MWQSETSLCLVYWSFILTHAVKKALTDDGEQSKCDEITKTGSEGRGYVVRVDAHLLGSNNHTNH